MDAQLSATPVFVDRVVVTLPASAAGFHDLDDCIEAALERGPRTVVLDLTSISHVSSATVAALLWTRRRCSLRGVDVQLRNVSRRCLRALDQVGLLSVVPVEERSDPEASESQPLAAPRAATATAETPGVTRFDLACGPHLTTDVLAATRGWAEDRALSADSAERLCAVVRAGTAHGMSFAPRFVTVRISWLDPDRVRLDLRWRGCTHTATARPGDFAYTIATLDTVTAGWGFADRGTGWLLWTVVDTR